MDPTPSAETAPSGGRLSLRKLLRHSSIYSLAPILQRIAAIVLIPLYTEVLADTEWGILDLADVLILLLPQLVGANLLGGMTRFYFEHEDQRARNAVVSTTTLLVTLAAWAVVFALLPFRTELADFLFRKGSHELSSGTYTEIVTLALLIVPFSLSTRAGVQYLQILKRSSALTAILTAKTVLELSLRVWMLVGLEWGMRGFLLGTLIGEALTAIGLCSWVLWRVKPRIVWSVFGTLWRYGLPLLPVGLFQIGLHQIDRLLLKHFDPGEGSDWNGVYALGYKVAFLIHTAVLASFMQIWQPLVFDAKQGASGDIKRVGTYAMFVLAACYLPVIVFGHEIVLLLAGQPSYLPAFRVVPWATYAYLFYALYALSQVSLFIAKRTWPLFWINGSCLLVNVGLNLVLIPRFGFVGAAWATVGSFLMLAVLGAHASRRLGPLPFEPRRVVGLFVVAGLCVLATRALDEGLEGLRIGGAAQALPPDELAGVIALKLGLCAAGAAFLWLGVLDRTGRAGLTRLIADVLKRRRRA